MEFREQKPTFGSRLKEKRIEKGWSQYYLAARAGCTNSNISYLESHPKQKPKLETVESIAAALDWPINEARRLAGYREIDDNLSPLEVEDDFRLSLHGYKELSEQGRELVRKQIGQIIDFVSECERGAGGQRAGLTFEQQAAAQNDGNVPEMTLDELQERIGKKKGNKE
jgi:transcriptional regulator with XRE-family HTH domain